MSDTAAEISRKQNIPRSRIEMTMRLLLQVKYSDGRQWRPSCTQLDIFECKCRLAFERVRNRLERVAQVAANRAHDRDDHHCNQAGDQAVFNGRNAGFVSHITSK